jgi:phage anti-repressor protein
MQLFPMDTLFASEFSVDGKRLHQWLGVGARFNMWVARRIKSLELVEGVDFILLRNEQNEINEFRVTIPIAKEIGMAERNAKGKEVRRYFLNCERVALVEYPKVVQELIAAQQALYDAQRSLESIQMKMNRPKKELILRVPVEVPVLPGFPPHTELRIIRPLKAVDPLKGMAEIWFHERQIEGIQAKIEEIKARVKAVA